MAATPQERLALGVAALLLAAGAAARTLGTAPPAPELTGGVVAEASAGALAAHVRDSVARAARRREPLAQGERLDPNTASADELDRLPRVGPALAGRIVEWRAAHGPFRTLDDFDAVPGVGAGLMRQAAPHLALAPAARRPPSANAAPVADYRTGATVNVNRATAAELAALPGIGLSLAARIVASREAEGPFRTLDDLLRVPGIGAAKLQRLRGVASLTP